MWPSTSNILALWCVPHWAFKEKIKCASEDLEPQDLPNEEIWSQRLFPTQNAMASKEEVWNTNRTRHTALMGIYTMLGSQNFSVGLLFFLFSFNTHLSVPSIYTFFQMSTLSESTFVLWLSEDLNIFISPSHSNNSLHWISVWGWNCKVVFSLFVEIKTDKRSTNAICGEN